MAQTKEQKLQKAIATQKRARQRAIDKSNSPEQRAKVKARATLTQEKARAKQQSPEYKASKIFKAKARLAVTTAKKPRQIKSRGLAGKSRNAGEKELHDKMSVIGCIACINQGITAENDGSFVSIHHCFGRTKASAHEECLPLCQWHHDTPMEKQQQALYPSVYPLHAKLAEGGKGSWEKENGTQEELIVQVWTMINYTPIFSTLLHTNK